MTPDAVRLRAQAKIWFKYDGEELTAESMEPDAVMELRKNAAIEMYHLRVELERAGKDFFAVRLESNKHLARVRALDGELAAEKQIRAHEQGMMHRGLGEVAKERDALRAAAEKVMAAWMARPVHDHALAAALHHLKDALTAPAGADGVVAADTKDRSRKAPEAPSAEPPVKPDREPRICANCGEPEDSPISGCTDGCLYAGDLKKPDRKPCQYRYMDGSQCRTPERGHTDRFHYFKPAPACPGHRVAIAGEMGRPTIQVRCTGGACPSRRRE